LAVRGSVSCGGHLCSSLTVLFVDMFCLLVLLVRNPLHAYPPKTTELLFQDKRYAWTVQFKILRWSYFRNMIRFGFIARKRPHNVRLLHGFPCFRCGLGLLVISGQLFGTPRMFHPPPITTLSRKCDCGRLLGDATWKIQPGASEHSKVIFGLRQ